jgi:hypothetical protein
MALRGRQLEGLLARRQGAGVVSQQPADKHKPGQDPSQPSLIVERESQNLGRA